MPVHLLEKKKIDNLGFIIKLQDESAISSAGRIIQSLLKKNSPPKIFVEEPARLLLPKALQKKIFCLSLNAMTQKLGLIVVVGGDGTILRCARYLLKSSAWKTCGLLGVNAGRIGFLASMSTQEAQKKLPTFLENPKLLSIETRMCLKVEIKKRKRNQKKIYHVLNDVVLSKGTLSRIFEFQVNINQKPLSLYRADGLIISPPTGSTAYNLAAGGSIVEPQIPAIQLAPIAPQSFSNKPILVSDQNRVQLSLRRHSTDIFLTLDGHTGIRVDDQDHIEIQRSEKSIQFLIPKEELKTHFFHSLRQKLNWGIVPNSST
jgi:NAD+ kinase